MAFSQFDILNEFCEASQIYAPRISNEQSLYVYYLRKRLWLREGLARYRELHKRPKWREERARKARERRKLAPYLELQKRPEQRKERARKARVRRARQKEERESQGRTV